MPTRVSTGDNSTSEDVIEVPDTKNLQQDFLMFGEQVISGHVESDIASLEMLPDEDIKKLNDDLAAKKRVFEEQQVDQANLAHHVAHVAQSAQVAQAAQLAQGMVPFNRAVEGFLALLGPITGATGALTFDHITGNHITITVTT